MSSNPPTVIARYHVDAVEDRRLCDPAPVLVSTGVTVEVIYPSSDPQAALALLEVAVVDVRRQIADLAEGGQRP